ncbi:MAG: MFS transporter [Candidatus Omnitrophica bacterium]|nr:MFS transporter [Candidatus Omnitrophota bacterium]
MINFFKKHPFLLSFGISQLFFSAPGQTFLISLFIGAIFRDLEISLSSFAGVYSTATLLAALLLNPAGRLIDRYPIQTIVKYLTILMALGCFILAGSKNIYGLFLGFFLLRLIGQGVFSLASSTLMVKNFHKNRGKAMGIITLGFPFSEMIYPFISLYLLQHFGWRTGFIIFGLSNIFIMLPLQLFLLKKSNINHGEFQAGETNFNPQNLPGNPPQQISRTERDCTVSEALKDVKFYLILIASCLPPMVVTGLLFYQEALFVANGWEITFAVTGLFVYALSKAVSSLWIGGIVDRYGPLIPFIFLIILLGVGTLLPAMGGSKLIILLYYSLIGAALGFSSPVTNVIYPYFYGTKHMGSIKGLIAMFRNGITAFGPLPIAFALDAGYSINTILFWISILIFVLSALPIIIYKLDRNENIKAEIR